MCAEGYFCQQCDQSHEFSVGLGLQQFHYQWKHQGAKAEPSDVLHCISGQLPYASKAPHLQNFSPSATLPVDSASSEAWDAGGV